MKLLKKLLLINWHYFSHEMIEFDGINFLTGKNASGKSTIIDALQLIFLADTSGSFFNKAANGKSNRTLGGYLRGETGDDGGSGFVSLRQGKYFTSYICAEFFDNKKNVNFSAGCCFDHHSENDIQRLFFMFDGAMPQNEFIEGKVPVDIRGLRNYLKVTYAEHQKYTTDTAKDYKDKLYAKLGALPQRFSDLLRKAVPFNPIADISQFITEFIFDEEQYVDISLMQENIRNYRSLETEADKLSKRVEALEAISKSHDQYIKHESDEKLYSYLTKRAAIEIARNNLNVQRSIIKNNTTQINEHENIRDGYRLKREHFSEELITNETERRNDTATQTRERINGLKKEIQEDLNNISSLFERMQNTNKRILADWKTKSNIPYSPDMLIGMPLDALVKERLTVFQTAGDQLLSLTDHYFADFSAETIIRIGMEALSSFAEKGDLFSKIAYETKNSLDQEQKNIATQITEARTELELLKKGIFSFPRNVTDLREIILRELQISHGLEVRVEILAELIDIKNDRWRNAIEGYLNTQKFNILVAPEHYREALSIYNRLKKQKEIYGVGLVDIEKIIGRKPICQKNSLAEEIETAYPHAKVYIDYLLGRVIKCDNVQMIRNFPVAITDECMLYQGYVARKLDPKSWASPAIGRNAVLKKLEQVKAHLQEMEDVFSFVIELKKTSKNASELERLSNSDVSVIFETAEKYIALPTLQNKIVELDKELASIDDSHLTVLKNKIESLKRKVAECQENYDSEVQILSDLSAGINAARQIIPQIELEISGQQSVFDSNFDKEWIDKTGDLRYMRERSIKKTLEEIKNNFTPPMNTAKNRKDAEWTNLRDLRMEYIRQYKAGYDIDSHNNEEFENIWYELTEIKLPEYITKIEDTRKKSFEQFQEDFLSRLKSNIENAERQIKNLNDAIKINFSEDNYRFRVIPKDEYRRYYDMITSDILTNGYNLFSVQFNETYKDEIEELFSMITSPGVGGSEDYDKRVREFTNYRTYLDFDLEVFDEKGSSQRLSKTLNKKSGGETQTPFYIAVLASFAQIYRIGRDKSENTIRIIIFDEAFSKMDGERITKSIELLRRFNFQVVLSAPPDKIGEIATLVDRNLCVFREGTKAFVRTFSPHRIGDVHE